MKIYLTFSHDIVACSEQFHKETVNQVIV